LSPHVSFTEFLESSTKLYGVPLLLSEDFYKLLSEEAAKYCRCVDRLRKSAAEAPMRLYTYDSDVNIDWEVVEKTREARIKKQRRKSTVIMLQPQAVADGDVEVGDASTQLAIAAVDRLAPPVIIVPAYTEDVWTEDLDLIELRHHVNEGFRSLWAAGVEAYIEGDWPQAKQVFDKTMELSHSRDGPSKFLLEEINAHHGVAPSEWQGYRLDGDGH
jgi:hypothetical protein